MAGGWLDHRELKIIKGFGKTAGDANSAEPDPVIVNLMSGPISLVEWSPNIPQVKNSGVWADSPLADGRQLLAASLGNVTEKITVRLTDSSYLGVMKLLSGLNQMVLDCRDFWQSEYQVDPVYLLWYAGCGAGQQFALLYNIELAPEYEDSPNPTIRVSMTLEREPGWRGVAPGDNPKKWAYYVNASHPQFSANTAQLYSGSDHLWFEEIANRHELNTDYVTPISKNYVDIPASLVPGDLPALVFLDMMPYLSTTSDVGDFYIAKSTRPITKSSHPTVKTFKTLSLLNAGDAVISAGSKVNSSDGVISNGSTTLKYYADITFSASPQTRTITWGNSNTLIKNLDINTLRGRYAFFLRHRLNGTALNQFTVQLAIREGAGLDNTVDLYQEMILDSQQPTTLNGAGLGAYWGLVYLGSAILPLNHHALSGVEGLGLKIITDAELSLQFIVSITRSAGAASMHVLDLVLLPLDEGFVHIKTPNDPTSRTSLNAGDKWHMVYDNTCYVGHGDQVESGAAFFETSAGIRGTGFNMELFGSELYLTPHVNNRLFFLTGRFDVANGSFLSSKEFNPQIRLNIVPRWQGIRSE